MNRHASGGNYLDTHRKAVSLRMKKYWAARRKEKAADK